uniref:Secreted protein n=1 Tax=uncultured bacterium Contig1514 TaxID=1393445 RepID=W0FNI4_9BACT|nr:secreted protein [uncultured bacterium Contig1514]
MRKVVWILTALLAAGCSRAPKDGVFQAPRTIVTCDPELDDNNSMVRFLLHATDYQIDGLVYTSSRFHWLGDGKGTTQFVPGAEYDNMGLGPQTSWRFNPDERFIDDIIDAYAACYANLKVHDSRYPSPEYLRSVTKWGNCVFEGDYSYDTEGSELIKANILDDKPGPLFIQAWGGSSSIAAALRSIEDQYKGTDEWDTILTKVNEKVILCLSGDQDNAYNSYIAVNWPDIWVWNTNAQLGRYTGNPSLTDPAWTARYMTLGPIGARVRLWGDGKQMVPGDKTDFIGPSAGKTREEMTAEGYYVWTNIQPQGTLYGDGDSGCFYMLIDNGLRAWQDPTWGGWSGRWDITRGAPQSGHPAYMGNNLAQLSGRPDRSRNAAAGNGPAPTGASPGLAAMMRAGGAEDHTFPNLTPERNLSEAARMKWSVTPNFADANHYPIVTGPFALSAKPGETVKIKASAQDPDGDALALKWWYFPVGTYVLTNDSALAVDSPDTAETTFTVPADAKPGETIHFVLQAQDDGDPVLTKYLRTVITVK